MFKFKILVIFLFAVFSSKASHAENFRLYIKEDLLNKLSSKIPEQTYGGSHVIKDPFFGTILYSGEWKAKLSKININIAPQEATFTAKVNSSYNNLLKYNTTIEGDLNFAVENNEVVLKFENVEVPLKFNIPNIGNITILTLPVSFEKNIKYPLISKGAISPRNQKKIGLKTRNAKITLLNNMIKVSGGTLLW